MAKFDINKEKIDLVYLWCDNSDKNWSEKKAYWQKQLGLTPDTENSTADCRFRNNDELKYSLRSIEKFAPWINKIFIVTDNQIPNWLDTNNPKIEVVFHKDFIEEEYLPCFNSVALEFHLHKIKGLSEYFLYANDDMFLGRPAKKTDFFNKLGNPIERVKKLEYTKEQIQDSKNFVETISIDFNKCMFLSNVAIYNKFGIIPNFIDIHNITAYRKSLNRECCEVFSDIIHNTCIQKFRQGMCVERILMTYYTYYKKSLEKKKTASTQKQKFLLTKSRYNPLRFLNRFEYITIHLGKQYTPYAPDVILEEKPLLFCINETISTRERHRELFKKMINKYFPHKSSFEKKEQVNICLSCDDNFIIHCVSAISSIVENASCDSFLNIHFLHKSLSKKNKQAIEKVGNTKNSRIIFRQVEEKDFSDCPIPENTHFSIETYFRMKIPSLFPSIDKILYIDCDTITLGDITALWNTDITNYYAAVCQDIITPSHLIEFTGKHKYFNAGIMLINCKKWREHNIEAKCFEFVKNHGDKIVWVDQDVLNPVLAHNIKYFGMDWNLLYNPGYDLVSNLYKDSEINLIHYISRNKPWNTNIPAKYAKYYYKYAFKTPWKLKTLKNYINSVILTRIPMLHNIVEDRRLLNRLKNEVQNKRVVLWGASLYLKKLIKYHNLNTPEIIGIIDRDPGKSGQRMGKYQIYHPNSLKSLNPDEIISSVVNHPKMKDFISEELSKQNLDIEVNAKIFNK